MVLGLNWLTLYNLLVDWALRSITFHSMLQESVTLLMSSLASSSMEALPPLPPNPLIVPPTPPDSLPPQAPSISLANAVTFKYASKLLRSQVFQISLIDIEASVHAATVMTETLVCLHNVPQKYHNFADVFSKGYADMLPSQCSYNLKIKLEDGTIPPFRPIYSLSQLNSPHYVNFWTNT